VKGKRLEDHREIGGNLDSYPSPFLCRNYPGQAGGGGKWERRFVQGDKECRGATLGARVTKSTWGVSSRGKKKSRPHTSSRGHVSGSPRAIQSTGQKGQTGSGKSHVLKQHTRGEVVRDPAFIVKRGPVGSTAAGPRGASPIGGQETGTNVP